MRTITIGREQGNDLQIDHPAVSGMHSEIHIDENGAMQYVDHSTNGTMINGKYLCKASCGLAGDEVICLPGNIELSLPEILQRFGMSQQPIYPAVQPAPSVSPATSPATSPAFSPNPSANKAQPSASAPQSGYMVNPGMGFGETLVNYFRNYATFRGRARRKEYFYIWLWNIIFTPLFFLWWPVTLIPSLALCARRLQDSGKNGWLLLLGIIPFIGPIIIFIFILMDSEPGVNKWGPSPKYQ